MNSPAIAKKLITVVALFGIFIVSTLASGAEKITFNQDIRPILSDRCFLCHGPDAATREADLRLDIEEEAFKALEFGAGSHVIKPGDPQQSEVYLRISTDDPDSKMPPPKSKIELTQSQIDLIRQWIQEGAKYEGHWAFLPPVKADFPQVEQEDWVRNEIDRFVLRRIEERKLQPNPEAAKEKLLRRVSFDLTGLPPTLEELDAFAADTSENAYEKTVDRLLASEAYGERMASDWLDVARYSDTYGYQVDRDRHVWPWRDWVVRAFNKNMPYDQFITEQLAGDLLPNATDDQILATTFNRLHPQKVEGGSTPEEFRIEYVADRTQTFGTAFLGLTLECCRCHDHKFDPITQSEYYQFSAFFDNIDEAGLYSFFTPAVPTPTLLLANDSQKKSIADLKASIAAEEDKLKAIADTQQAAFQTWLKEKPEVSAPVQGEVAYLDFEKVDGRNKQVEGVFGNAAQLTGDDVIGTEVGNFNRAQPFSVSLWMLTPDVKDRAVIFHRSRAWTDAGSRGYQLLIEEGKLSASLIHFWPGNAIRIKTKNQIPTKQWQHVVMTYDGSSRAAGLKIFIDGMPAECEVVRDNLTKQITGGGGDHIAIGERFRDRGFTNGLVDEFRVFDRRLTRQEVGLLSQRSNDVDTKERHSEVELYETYLNTVDEAYRAQLETVLKKRSELNTLIDGIAEIMVMRELEQKKPTYRLARGAYDAPAEKVTAQTPTAFFPLPDDETPNRLTLSKWLTSPEHPLTSRVAVNRIWQMLFGQGLVRTPEDFGSQGELPTHPELLDWLAVNFIENGWDTKQLIKQIVMSATYRQSSDATPFALQTDPENRRLSRAPNYRLPAEMLRDNALAVSGLLVQKQGGSPAKPYEVEVSFKPTTRSKGEGLYRRSLYTYWKRTGPAPVMMTLDASKREVCRVKREQTSSPLQAFVMLNGPQFVEASRGLAQRLIHKNGDDVEKSLVDMFRTLTSRQPTDEELDVLKNLYESQRKSFSQHPQQAKDYLTVGDLKPDETLDPSHLAAMTTVANALLNFDECVIKR
ncbi:DUF1553 domain-containing protein [Thalassoglobus sp.]|uniref:DUF1553 domain-containing protein n=1 Tax=Thalassoglobus sp. TaxID=2795869 RepID=UPI003AA992F7